WTSSDDWIVGGGTEASMPSPRALPSIRPRGACGAAVCCAHTERWLSCRPPAGTPVAAITGMEALARVASRKRRSGGLAMTETGCERRCYSCGADSSDVLRSRERLFGSGVRHSYLHCRNCGHLALLDDSGPGPIACFGEAFAGRAMDSTVVRASVY